MAINENSYLTELLALDSAAASTVAKYNALASFFFDFIDEQTATSSINFAGPFAKTDYLLTEANVAPELARAVNAARNRFRHRATLSDEVIESAFRTDLAAVADFVATVCNLELPSLFDAPQLQDYVEASDPDYTRTIVRDVDGFTIYISPDEAPDEEFVLDCSDESRRYLCDICAPLTQLNLVRPIISGNRIEAEHIIYEPDYLVNVSQIASCFESYATDARISIVRKFSRMANTPAINLGNFASQLLDEEIHHAESNDFRKSADTFFRNNTINLATCELPATFRNDAHRQQINIRRAIKHDLPENVSGFSRDRVILEPGFFSEMLGLQARMDLMQLDYKVLIEQKSGKGAWPQADPRRPRHTEQHYVQLLLYMAIMRLNYRAKYEANDRRLNTFLLYSRYDEPLVALGPAPELLHQAFVVRNMIVYYEQQIASGNTSVLTTLTPDELNKHGQGKLWEQYQRPQLGEILNPFTESDSLSMAYFSRMLQFVTVEHLLAKIGNKSKRASGFASAWHNSVAEKLEAGNIYIGLQLTTPSADYVGKVEEIALSFAPDKANDMANFRTGDAVILYAYTPGTEPDARRTIVFRCSIIEIGVDYIHLALRFAQSSAAPFTQASDLNWAIEHDYIDSSQSALYQGLHTFLTAPDDRRDLLLMRRTPSIDTSRRLTCDHGNFNDLALHVKQANDIFLIIGPPGTGKTSFGMVTTLREQLADGKSSVLLLSYTNRAVDEICSKLVEEGIDFMRIGPSLSCAPEYRGYLLKEKTADCSTVTDVRHKIAATRVFAATVSSFNGSINLLNIKNFDLAIIDEASQIPEPHLLGTICARTDNDTPAIKKIVMIGDHKQLPAVVQQTPEESAVADPTLQNIGLTDCRLSLFERLLHCYGDDPTVTHLLSRQGRMHVEIAEFPNQSFYCGKLDDAGLPHQNAELPIIEGNDLISRILNHRVAFVDIAEAPTLDTPDKINHSEADFIATLATTIYYLEPDFSADDTIGIIVPYRNQIGVIRQALQASGIDELANIAIDTVERFQGSQRKYIIYGFTVKRRSQLNFLTEHTFTDIDGSVVDRKLNVAMTRAREHLILIGNATLIAERPVFHKLIEYTKAKKEYFNASI